MTETKDPMRDGTKAVLDMLRNVAIVIGIGVFNKKHPETWLAIIYWISLMALIANATTYLPLAQVADFFSEHPRFDKKWAIIVTLILLVPFALVLNFYAIGKITAVIDRQITNTDNPAPQNLLPCRFTLTLTDYRCI